MKNLINTIRGMYLEEKKKLDPVGKADADIDNDGDVDDSDEYLHNRRKAVSKAIKGKGESVDTKPKLDEEAELEEANKYGFGGTHNPKIGDKVTHKPTGATGTVKSITTQGNETHVNFKSDNDSAHIKKGEMVSSNMKHTKVHKEEVESIEEGTPGRYELIRKAAKKVQGDEKKAMRDAMRGVKKDKDLKKPKKDAADIDEEQIDELTKSTLQNYTKKAIAKSKEHSQKANQARMYSRGPGDDASKEASHHDDMAVKRGVGARRASYKVSSGRYTKESVEFNEEVIAEGNAAMELKKYGNSKGGIDKQDFIAVSNMIAKKKSAKEIAQIIRLLDTDPRDKILSIIKKNDQKLFKDMNLTEETELAEADINRAAQRNKKTMDDKDSAPFEGGVDRKGDRKDEYGNTVKNRAKHLAKKGMKTVTEEEMTPAQKRKKEEIVKSMKDKKDYFDRKYGARAKDVMYATATKMAMKEGLELSEKTLAEMCKVKKESEDLTVDPKGAKPEKKPVPKEKVYVDYSSDNK